MLKSLFFITISTFMFNTVSPSFKVFAQSPSLTMLNLPKPGAAISMSPNYTPLLVKGIKINPKDPLQFDFIVDTGDFEQTKNHAETIDKRPETIDQKLKTEAEKLIKYFLASLTIPEKDLWVNLSPYEKNRIIPNGFAQTQMGRDLLSQDYILKQLTASLMHPDSEFGKKFWGKIYTRAKDLYGTAQIPVNTFNKVWIVPEKALIYQNEQGAFVVSSHLKVMLEEDYLALSRQSSKLEDGSWKEKTTPSSFESRASSSRLGSQIVREIFIPAIEQEVNEGKNFSILRQIYHSMILAAWYKKNLKQGLLSRAYIDKNKTKGIDDVGQQQIHQIYDLYLKAFKKGAVNFIREDYDAATQTIVPRKYFSGGVQLEGDYAMVNTLGKIIPGGQFRDVQWKMQGVGNPAHHTVDFAVSAQESEWNKRGSQFLNGANISILGATGFVGRYFMADLLKQFGSEIGQVKILTRNPDSQNAQQMFNAVKELPGNEKLAVVQGDQLNIGQLRSAIAGSKVIVSTAGLAWQHPGGGTVNKEEYGQYIQDIQQLSDRDMKDEILLRQELIQNGISAALLGLMLNSDQRLVWTSTNAVDNMFLRLSANDRKRLKEEINARATRYLAEIRRVLTNGTAADIVDAEKFFMRFVSNDLQDHPPIKLPKVQGSSDIVSYAKILSYNYSKYLGQRLLELIHEEEGKDIRVLMISDVYGPGQSIDRKIITAQGGLRRPQVFLAAYRAIRAGYQEWIPDVEDKQVHGFNMDSATREITQKVWRDYVAPTFVGDVSKMILHASSANRSDFSAHKAVFNVSAPPISNIDFARKLRGLSDASVKIKTSGEKLFVRPQGQDSDLEALGIRLTSLEDGISKWITQEEGDKATLSKGGIDLNSNYLDLTTQGRQVDFAALAGSGNPNDLGLSEGFVPRIIKVSPIENIHTELGIK